MSEAEWSNDMDEAPRDGAWFVGLVNDEEVVVRWAETRKCMLANVAPGAGRFGEGWECNVDGGLICDPPTKWRYLKDGESII